MKITAIVPAAGESRRMRPRCEKLFVKVKGRPILLWTLQRLNESAQIDEIIVVASKKRLGEVTRYRLRKLKAAVEGGPRRFDSVYNGLMEVDEDTDFVLVHDGARPCVTSEVIRRTIDAARKAGAAVCGVPIVPTIKELNSDGYVASTLNRDLLWEIQTPQVFKRRLLIKAFERAKEDGMDATDEAALVERLGHRVKVVMGSQRNIKITTPEDLRLARAVIKETRAKMGPSLFFPEKRMSEK